MIPPELSENILSLKQGAERKSISLLCRFTKAGELIDYCHSRLSEAMVPHWVEFREGSNDFLIDGTSGFIRRFSRRTKTVEQEFPRLAAVEIELVVIDIEQSYPRAAAPHPFNRFFEGGVFTAVFGMLPQEVEQVSESDICPIPLLSNTFKIGRPVASEIPGRLFFLPVILFEGITQCRNVFHLDTGLLILPVLFVGLNQVIARNHEDHDDGGENDDFGQSVS